VRESEVHIDAWNFVRRIGKKTLQLVSDADAWDFRLNAREFSVQETLKHTFQAIYEDAGNWFLEDGKSYKATENLQDDLDTAIDRMIGAIQELDDTRLSTEFTTQWGERMTVRAAIRQNMFHTVEHLAQVRERVGVLKRQQT
jgi:hypothetical protein